MMTMMIKVDNTILSYIAGFIDGEGSLGFIKHKELRRKNNTFSLEPSISISNTNKDVMEFISSILGNKVRFRKSNHPNHKDQYHLYYHGIKNVKYICELLMPFLKVKKKNAEMLLNFIYSRQSNSHRKITYSNQELECYIQVKKLNRRGAL